MLVVDCVVPWVYYLGLCLFVGYFYLAWVACWCFLVIGGLACLFWCLVFWFVRFGGLLFGLFWWCWCLLALFLSWWLFGFGFAAFVLLFSDYFVSFVCVSVLWFAFCAVLYYCLVWYLLLFVGLDFVYFLFVGLLLALVLLVVFYCFGVCGLDHVALNVLLFSCLF